ncbi:hypothetical protein F383_37791 [Gossypium arboreum]|uniref:Uncharacterized protein n=1 Tax=Gossypium arboreum TaxID=29729 RepID=A0A0B0MDR8_GOSAR|nr:hypothetical protein F383_37791 [Gossypium arboreum]
MAVLACPGAPPPSATRASRAPADLAMFGGIREENSAFDRTGNVDLSVAVIMA